MIIKRATDMDLIMMEKSDFDKLIGRIDEIAEHIRKSEKSKSPGRADRWLSGKEATDILGVSTRTLQRYRNIGLIPFSKLGKKCRYCLSDVERVLDMCRIDGREENPDGLRRQYLVRMGKMPGISKKT